jgi:methionyl-tRNA formyltransferase
MKILLMADDEVGFAITQWLLTEYQEDISLVVTTAQNEISNLVKQHGIEHLIFKSTNQIYSFIKESNIELDLGFLVWWPKIIKQPLINLPKYGFINTHPSFLPHNRGKNYNFWALVERTKFGVSLHFVEEGIDNGDIVAQAIIPYNWEDNGESLYNKARCEMVNLFKETYPAIRTLNITRQKQNLNDGSFHLSSEINEVSYINLDDTYIARDLLNLLRARTFRGHPACWFEDDGDEYEIRVEITRKIK